MQALGFEQGGQQGMLILAIAVLVVKNIPRSVGLIAAHTQRQADVAEVPGDEIVESLDLIQVVVEAFGEFGGFGAGLARGRAAVLFQTSIPESDLFPTDERG